MLLGHRGTKGQTLFARGPKTESSQQCSPAECGKLFRDAFVRSKLQISPGAHTLSHRETAVEFCYTVIGE
jgi:hypothetical protein